MDRGMASRCMKPHLMAPVLGIMNGATESHGLHWWVTMTTEIDDKASLAVG